MQSGVTAGRVPASYPEEGRTMADLISRAYAQEHIGQASFTSAENTLTDDLVASCSVAIRRFCRREFNSQQFDELYRGNDSLSLILAQTPIISIDRVLRNPTTVVEITNTVSTNQQ